MCLSQVKTAQYSVCESKSKFIFFSIDAEDETNNFAIEAITLPAGYSSVVIVYSYACDILSLFPSHNSCSGISYHHMCLGHCNSSNYCQTKNGDY